MNTFNLLAGAGHVVSAIAGKAWPRSCPAPMNAVNTVQAWQHTTTWLNGSASVPVATSLEPYGHRYGTRRYCYLCSLQYMAFGTVQQSAHMSDANGNELLPNIKWISNPPAIRFLYRSLPPHSFTRKVPNFRNKTEKIIPGQMLGQGLPENNSTKMYNSKRRDAESSTDIDRRNQRLRHEVWTARAR